MIYFILLKHIFNWVINMNVIICGSEGKTGSKVYQLLKENSINIVGCVNEHKTSLKELLKLDIPIDYVIDFTIKDVAYNHILQCIESNISFICGTTGFNKEELNNIKQLLKDKPISGIICPNFSIPLNCLIKEFNTISQNFDKLTILEQHHKSKKDKPSGTGKLLNSLSYCKSNIISLDSEDYIIYYRIQFESKCDKMIITYQVDDKTAYAKGVLYYLQSNKKDLFVNLI